MAIVKYLAKFYRYFYGIIVQNYVNITKRNIIFRDPLGFVSLLQPGDSIATYYNRNSVTDAHNIINFLFKYGHKGWICVDIGANQGSVSIPLWQIVGVKEGKVISIEPDPMNFDRIKTNLCLNNVPDFYIENVAISNENGETDLRIYPKCNGWQTFGNPSFAFDYESYLIKVPTIRFDTLMKKHSIGYIHIVKIDTEGAELLVLESMRNFLEKKGVKCVIFEVNYLMLEGMDMNVSQLISYWSGLPYDLYQLTNSGTLTPLNCGWPEQVVGDCVAIVKED